MIRWFVFLVFKFSVNIIKDLGTGMKFFIIIIINLIFHFSFLYAPPQKVARYYIVQSKFECLFVCPYIHQVHSEVSVCIGVWFIPSLWG